MSRRIFKQALRLTGLDIKRHDPWPARFQKTYEKFKDFTMIPDEAFVLNLELIHHYQHISGSFVECGVWRGGMSAAAATWLGPNHRVHMFDSFEGLPQAQAIDGKEALAWQNNKDAPGYFDNCKAEQDYCIKAMNMAGATNFEVHAGWFQNTIPQYGDSPIAILRLDGDWYDSIMVCLEGLFPKVREGGVIILDDYYTWDGCAKAVHDYLSRGNSPSRIFQWKNQVAYIIKKN